MEDIAAHNLLNRTLQEGWRVVEKKEKKAGDTGGTFSVCYIVEKEGKKYFMKAFNVNGFINCIGGGKTFMELNSFILLMFHIKISSHRMFCYSIQNRKLEI